MRSAPRLVLDTNACLDLLLFGDPRATALHAALRAGSVIAMTDEACRAEWLRVLAYPQLELTALQRQDLIRRHDELAEPFVNESPAIGSAVHQASLPRCADPDDQKFLVLAQACGARWLISRDKLLLKLARRTRRDGLFDIVPPEAWVP